MIALLQVVLPVFLVIGAGYLAVRSGYIAGSVIDGLMAFTQGVAIPVLLFRAIGALDLGEAFRPGVLVPFYTGMVACFALAVWGARRFGRRPGESVAVGFTAMFSNTVLIGLPIVERAYGAAALPAAFAVIAAHAPANYLIGITAMEVSRADGRSLPETARVVARAMLANPLTIGLAAGFAVNLTGLTLPGPVNAATEMVARSALPAALFGLGGVLVRYGVAARPAETAMVCGLSLILHPTIAFALGAWVFDLPPALLNPMVLTAAMAPGVNSYVFASMYRRAQDLAASTVLLGTAASVLSVSAWLAILG